LASAYRDSGIFEAGREFYMSIVQQHTVAESHRVADLSKLFQR
jgi:hypothetical protein